MRSAPRTSAANRPLGPRAQSARRRRIIRRACHPPVGPHRVAGERGDALLVRLAAPPVDGAANDALVEYLADIFARPKRDVTLLSGHASRDKLVAIAGVTPAQAAGILGAILSRQ